MAARSGTHRQLKTVSFWRIIRQEAPAYRIAIAPDAATYSSPQRFPADDVHPDIAEQIFIGYIE